jgi:hypothetical protein
MVDFHTLRAAFGAGGAGRAEKNRIAVRYIPDSEVGELQDFVRTVKIDKMTGGTGRRARTALVTKLQGFSGNPEQFMLKFRIDPVVYFSYGHIKRLPPRYYSKCGHVVIHDHIKLKGHILFQKIPVIISMYPRWRLFAMRF